MEAEPTTFHMRGGSTVLTMILQATTATLWTLQGPTTTLLDIVSHQI